MPFKNYFVCDVCSYEGEGIYGYTALTLREMFTDDDKINDARTKSHIICGECRHLIDGYIRMLERHFSEYPYWKSQIPK